MTRSLAWIGAGYLVYFGAVGVFQPYFPLHLAALGVSGAGIGMLLALWSAMRILGPLGAAWLADALNDRRVALRLFGVGSVLFMALLMLVGSLWAMAAALSIASFFFNGLVPVYDTYVLDRLGQQSHGYGRLRLWGSIGFIATSASFGVLSGRYGVQIVLPAAVMLVVCTAGILMGLPALPDRQRRLDAAGESFARALLTPRVLVFLGVCFFHLAGFGAYYGFYTLYLTGFGYSPSVIGLYWAAGVCAEIALFALAARILQRFSLSLLLELALGLSCLRWIIVAAVPQRPSVMLAAQVWHLAGLGLFHMVTVLLGPRLLPSTAAARAQALVSSVGWGAGGIAGSVLAGLCWDRYGHRSVFAVSAVFAGIAWLLAAIGLRGVASDSVGAAG